MQCSTEAIKLKRVLIFHHNDYVIIVENDYINVIQPSSCVTTVKFANDVIDDGKSINKVRERL